LNPPIGPVGLEKRIHRCFLKIRPERYAFYRLISVKMLEKRLGFGPSAPYHGLIHDKTQFSENPESLNYNETMA